METWRYKTQSDHSIRHIGPMAQDFYAAFDVGGDEKHIATVDADGVALAAIQGLYEIVQENQQEIRAQAREIAALRQQLAQAGDLQARVAELESLVRSLASGRQVGMTSPASQAE